MCFLLIIISLPKIYKVLLKGYSMNAKESANAIKAGSIAKEAVAYARTIVKKDVLLIEIADSIEKKIIDLGGKPAFPVNLSINEIAAHATPAYNDTGRAHGLLKVDLGVHIDGSVADTAFSVDLEGSKHNKELIASAESALAAAILVAQKKSSLSQIGAAIERVAHEKGFTPVHNLSGHSISTYDLHAGVTVPNYDNGDTTLLENGMYAIEPFITSGHGSVRDGKTSGIFQLTKPGAVRDPIAREILHYIGEEYQTLPFCSRWIYRKFGTRGLIGLKRIEEAGLLHGYPYLVESSGAVVAQAEHTIFIQGKDVTVTTA